MGAAFVPAPKTRFAQLGKSRKSLPALAGPGVTFRAIVHQPYLGEPEIVEVSEGHEVFEFFVYVVKRRAFDIPGWPIQMTEQYDRPLIENAATLIAPVLLRRQPDHLADDVVRTTRMDRGQLDPGLNPIDQRDPIGGSPSDGIISTVRPVITGNSASNVSA